MLAYTMPFWVVLFAWILLGDRPTRRHLWAFLLAGLGVFAILAPWTGLGAMPGSLLALGGGGHGGVCRVLRKLMLPVHAAHWVKEKRGTDLLGSILTTQTNNHLK